MINTHFKSTKYGDIPKWRPTDYANQLKALLIHLTDIVKTPTILAPLLTSPYIDKYPQPAYSWGQPDSTKILVELCRLHMESEKDVNHCSMLFRT
ncbi:hypothetical protein DFH05DRAFT_998648 [Lentinula detonsa]|uniref:Uncharacterized protein n=1 Tax=Lentinula detonsa TaxID=2804962 RepID=A0A9W8P1P9_9AGAR|nr:hypothetical protein DFH05DRAFT_998648 [Lentinula detonsa]